MRPGVQVRRATRSDLEDLVDLCLQARAEAAVGRQLCSDDRDRLRRHLAVLASMEDGAVLVGTCDGRTAGLALCRVLGPGPLTDAPVLALDAVYVSPQSRRRGLGHAMMQAAAEVADEAGADEVYAAPLPGSRGMQRFLARLGFAPAAAHRAVSTAALHRRLALDVPASRRHAARGIEDLVERRRRARARAAAEDDARQSGASRSMQVSLAVHSRRPSSSSTTTS